jgi:hypothetical protein
LENYFIVSSSVAEVAELVDARDSKSRAARRAGSIPALGTKNFLGIKIDENRTFRKDVRFFVFRANLRDF